MVVIGTGIVLWLSIGLYEKYLCHCTAMYLSLRYCSFDFHVLHKMSIVCIQNSFKDDSSHTLHLWYSFSSHLQRSPCNWDFSWYVLQKTKWSALQFKNATIFQYNFMTTPFSKLQRRPCCMVYREWHSLKHTSMYISVVGFAVPTMVKCMMEAFLAVACITPTITL